MMSVKDAIKNRFSVRAFTDQEVPKDVISNIINLAKCAPSGVNSQPWKVYVLLDEKKELLSKDVINLFDNGQTEENEYLIYPKDRPDWYKERQRAVGYGLYKALGIERDDIAGRLNQIKQNFNFFGAPVGIFITVDRSVGPNGWGHVGHFIQNICLAAIEEGMGTCLQEAWAEFPETVKKHIKHSDDEIVWCGISLGYPDLDHPVNKFRTGRESLEVFTEFL